MRDDVSTHPAGPAAVPTAAPRRGTSRWRWLVPALALVAWLAVGGVGGPFQGQLTEVQENDAAAFLPDGVESSEVSELAAGFVAGDALPALVVVTGDGPLDDTELQAVADLAERIPELPLVAAAGEADAEGAAGADGSAEGTAGLRTVADVLADTGAPGDGLGEPAGPEAADAAGPAEAPPGAPLTAGPVVAVPAEDGEAVLLSVPLDAELADEPLADGTTVVAAAVAAIRAADDEALPDGLVAYVTGPAGSIADLGEAFGELDTLLLAVAVAAVLVILLVVYRSPALPFIVISASVFALAAASIVVYYLAASGLVELSGQSQGILFILVVGAATDYALLLVARYREELRLHADPYQALRVAWRRAVEPIVASGSTVILGLLCLLLSDLASNRGLGPVASVGIVMAMLAALTFLPAALLVPQLLLVPLGVAAAAGAGALTAVAAGADAALVGGAATGGALVGLLLATVVAVRLWSRRRRRVAAGEPAGQGRWVFWPAEPVLGEPRTNPRGGWVSLARAVGRHPRRTWVLTSLALAGLAAFVPLLRADGVATSEFFLVEVESVTGQEALAEHFPAGATSPTLVLAGEQDAQAALDVVRATDGVDSATLTVDPAGPPGQAGPPLVVDGLVRIEAVLTDPADSLAAQDTVDELRERLDDVGEDVLVGGGSAQDRDALAVARADLLLIIPVVLGVIFVVLALLLRSLVAPLVLLAANVLSFGATLGASALVFEYVFGFPGADPAVPLLGFVFLIALGIDYSIFLMTRAREESLRRGARAGVLDGLAVTGGVITSAGIVLAATFAALGVLPLLFLAQIAFIVAFGVLIDTFVVRSLLVPALSYDIGRLTWWPHRMSRADSPGERAAAAPLRSSTTGSSTAVSTAVSTTPS